MGQRPGRCELCGKLLIGPRGVAPVDPIRFHIGDGYRSICGECRDRILSKSRDHRAHIHLRKTG